MSYPLPATLPDFNQASILVVGDVMLDRYWFGDTSRISPEAPVPIVKIAGADNRPGGAANVALNITAMGAKTTLLGIIGNDEAGMTLSQQLTAASVTHDLCMLDSISTIVKLRIISRHQQLLRMDFEEKLISEHHDFLIQRFKQHLPHANLVILSDYKKGTLSNPQTLIQLARAAGIPILVDPKGNDFSIYQHANIITPNFKEFETIVGHCNSEQDILDKGRKLLTKHQIDTLLVTRGENGMTLIRQHDSLHLPAYAREVLDVTGAGDTVISMLATAVAIGLDLSQATALANLAASIVISKLGAATVSVPELQVALTGKTSFATGIVNEEQLLKAVKEARAQGKKIVFTNGCFDVIHAGHVTYLQMAKQLGDYLIVAVNTDESIQKLKGLTRPINHLEHRMIVLAGLDVVDWVVPFADDTPEQLLQIIRPDTLVKGGEYQLNQVVGADIVHSYGGDVRILGNKISSSSSIINRIIGLEQSTTLNDEIKQYGS
ncbi:MAG: bifunctional D-glycero-beta-D-manno-heptose-7-phosphate kinase/D-glycero-beta-D-manno-heptose 1-phosphate adenylyltransferase HldE [Gammaproteobacteria bacterium]|nr:bifunctional D-glycero-beta-D-manno-heptose-7-phosphate kinase/D-glycero-beta-D-manno-heptose 1-phosphate adenylyltransferase HldE [Gammaproteobacteria bacterium]MCW5583463.1 bifunctional D-glycero-beta-D-manno-heptose-7-phosphate kinase/D-glycero-beta-D-manno-heptose 1-phosphate adenylyltransferase HldE [Gammaproteobacteria bacterium]